MVHDEKLTVPLLMDTPPPCKHKRNTCQNPIGAMGNFRALQHVHSVVDRSVVRSCASESRAKRVIFPIGAIGSFQGPLLHVQSVVDRSVGRSCAIVSRGKLVSNFPIGAMGNFEREHALQQLCFQ